MSSGPFLHPVLSRQLRRLRLERGTPPDAARWAELLDLVSQAYAKCDDDRYTLERAMSISSEELREAINRADSASNAKSLFLAHMSHEIRTPMTAILGHVELLLDPAHAGRCESAEAIRRNSAHLMGVIDQILDFTKIEGGKLAVEQTRFSPRLLLGEVVEIMQPRAQSAGVGLRLEIADAFPVSISADPIRLRQIMLNLVGNAIKFTVKGHVHISAECTAEGESARLRIRVRDTGVGISPENLERIFVPFMQADESITRRFGGTGLGLPISRELARAMKGDIEVSSVPGAGSVFSLWLPVDPDWQERHDGRPTERAETSSPPAAGDRPLEGVRILLAEDGEDNRRILCHFLRKAGAEVSVAEDGRCALARIVPDGPGQGPGFDVVLMDMQMPVLDGYAATERLRAAGINIPVIALTAHAMSGDREKCLAAGCSDYLTKPIERAVLIESCRRWAAGHAAA